ncbi:MAG: hypothetical protein ACIAQU_00595 [Phycisphaerales bacterium JB064]
MADRSAFEESLASIGRKIDAVIDGVRERRGRLHNRMATGGMFEKFRRPAGAPKTSEKMAERVAEVKERLEEGRVSAKLVVGAFGAGAVLVAVVMLVLVFGFGLFRGTGLTAADLERDAALRQAADRAQAEREGTLNPTAMMQRQQQDEAMAAEADEARRGTTPGSGRTGGDSAKRGLREGG